MFHSAQRQLRNDSLHPLVLVRGLVRWAGDDQRRSRLVDQDGVHLVDDGVVVSTLHAVLDIELHVVAQIIEAELVVGSIGDVGRVGLASLVVAQVMDNDAHSQAEELVYLAHPLGVALGQVVVDRDHVDALAGQGVEVAGEGCNQGLAFAGFHFRDLALMQHHAADQLHVEVTHFHGAPTRLAHHCEGLGHDFVQRLAFRFLDFLGVGEPFKARREPGLELRRFGQKLLVGKPLHLRLERADAGDKRY